MDWKTATIAVLLTTSALPGTGLATQNDPPEVDAGLDQTVPAGSTVLLDGSDTHDSDGHIVDRPWRIETPDGDHISPDCPGCERTRFQATLVGTYTVTLSVTDNDGATRTDTLYVTVTADDGPSVTLTGPTTAEPNEQITFNATTTAGTEPITTTTWRVDGTELTPPQPTTLSRRFASTGTKTIAVTATDEIGRSSTDTHRITIRENATLDPDPTSPQPDQPNSSDPGTPKTPIRPRTLDPRSSRQFQTHLTTPSHLGLAATHRRTATIPRFRRAPTRTRAAIRRPSTVHKYSQVKNHSPDNTPSRVSTHGRTSRASSGASTTSTP